MPLMLLKKKLKEGKIIIKDSIADIFLQQILTRPAHDVVAKMIYEW